METLFIRLSMIKKINWQQVLIALIVFLFFINPVADYDLGWHLRYGQYFWQNGKFLWTNTFAYTMPLFKWINHSYLYDPFVYTFFKAFGFFGISLLGAGFIYLTMTILFKAVHALPVEKVLASFLLFYFGVDSLLESLRSRYPSFVLMAILYLILSKYKKNEKVIYFLPLLFLIWVNVHGTFSVGLLFLGAFCIMQIINFFNNSKKLSSLLKLGLVGIASIAVTYFNPFHFDSILQALEHATSPYLTYINEYSHLEIASEHGIAMLFYLVIILVALFIRKKREFYLEAIALIPFVYLAFGAIRNIAIFMIFSIPLIIKLLHPLMEKVSLSKTFKTIFPLGLVAIFTALLLRFFGFNLYSYSWNSYCYFSSGCSVRAMEYLKANRLEGNGFTYYDWGGFLEWQAPEIKTFIDGRMHLWHDQEHYIIRDYFDVLRVEGNWEKIFKDYNFTWVLVPPKAKIVEKLNGWVQDGTWEKVYEDARSLIYVRTNPPVQITSPTIPSQ